MTLFNILDIAGSALNVQSKKININATNIANVDSMIIDGNQSYPYIAKKAVLKFDNQKNKFTGGVKVDKIILDSTPMKLLYDPNNPFADHNGYIKTSNVNVISEVIDSITSSKNYQANVEIINTVKSLLIQTLSICQ
ncbi:MAG: flagellar basal body rod protein FlgC [Buchnera aphidicola (Eriosoma harunire)]